VVIINADDWGRSRDETDAAADCFARGRITSVTAMVFMQDSERAAHVARERGIDVGLHLNLDQPFTGEVPSGPARERHERVVAFLTSREYAFLLYNPLLSQDFRDAYQAQYAEFVRLYGRPPSHVDGHHHLHLCTNMLLGRVITQGVRVRRSFHFWPGEKGLANRSYRKAVDWLLARRHPIVDYFFALPHCFDERRMDRVVSLARTAVVEIMTHPTNPAEHAFLTGFKFASSLGSIQAGTYAAV